MTEEQTERLKQIQRWRMLHVSANSDPYADLARAFSDIDFLLSLPDSRAVQMGKWEFTADELERRYLNATRQGTATTMRSRCVEKIREYLTDCRDEERGILEAVAAELESLPLDQVEQEKPR